jgi:MscS family membrane protein
VNGFFRCPRALQVALAALLLALLAPASARAQEPAPGTTPRSTVERFLAATRVQDWVTAAEAIRQPGRAVPNAEVVARQLRAVLDRYVWIEPASLSDRPEGRLDDGLAPHLEEIARLPMPDGPEPVRLVRLASGQWVFSRDTIAHVPEWYGTLGSRWLRERLPEPLLRTGWLNLAWWQWIALPLLVLVSVLGSRLLGWLVQLGLRLLARRTATPLDDALIERLATPRNLALVSLLALALIPSLELSHRAEGIITRGTTVLLFVAVGWAAVRAVDVVAEFARGSRFVAQHPMTVGFMPLVTGLAKLMAVAITLGTLLQWLGLPVASLVASLGIGGLAVALAAKTTLENLLSAVTLGVDKPFRPGDYVKVEGVAGTVEKIGLRSTRIRTLDRTVVTLPNGKVADSKIETFAARDRIRLACTLGLEYGTTVDQMRAVLAGIEQALRAHPKIWPDTVTVAFKAFGESSLDVEVMAWFQTADWNEFVAIRQEMFLAFMRVVQEAGTGFAFPTRTVRVVQEGTGDRGQGTGTGVRGRA